MGNRQCSRQPPSVGGLTAYLDVKRAIQCRRAIMRLQAIAWVTRKVVLMGKEG